MAPKVLLVTDRRLSWMCHQRVICLGVLTFGLENSSYIHWRGASAVIPRVPPWGVDYCLLLPSGMDPLPPWCHRGFQFTMTESNEQPLRENTVSLCFAPSSLPSFLFVGPVSASAVRVPCVSFRFPLSCPSLLDSSRADADAVSVPS